MAINYLLADDWDEPQKVRDPGTGRYIWDKAANKAKEFASHESDVDGTEVLRLAKEGVGLLLAHAKTITAGGDAYKGLKELLKQLQNEASRSVFVTVKKGIHQFTKMPHLTARLVGEATLHVWLSTGPSGVTGRTLYVATAVSASEAGPYVPNCTTIRVAPVGRRRGSSIGKADATALIVLENERERERAERAAQLELENQEATNYLNAMAAAHGMPLPDYD